MSGRIITPHPRRSAANPSYRAFYTWSNIFKAASAHGSLTHAAKHLAYSAGWKKFEPAWDFVIRVKQLAQMRPMLEAVLSPVGRRDRSNIGAADDVSLRRPAARTAP